MSKVRTFSLSAFVCPGLGQVLSKRVKRGVTLIAMVVIGISMIVSVAKKAAENIMATGTQPDYDAVNQAIANDAQYASLGMLLIVFAWILSIIDALFIGQDKDEGKEGDNDSPKA